MYPQQCLVLLESGREITQCYSLAEGGVCVCVCVCVCVIAFTLLQLEVN